MNEIAELIYNNGVGIACLVYFLFRDYKIMSELKDTLAVVKNYLSTKEQEIKDGEKDD